MIKYFSILLLVITSTLLAGCDHEGDIRTLIKLDHHCTAETIDKRSDFILQCLKNANPVSDEEPEDWIHQCRTMAEKTICDLIQIKVTQKCSESIFGNCSWWRTEKLEPIIN